MLFRLLAIALRHWETVGLTCDGLILHTDYLGSRIIIWNNFISLASLICVIDTMRLNIRVVVSTCNLLNNKIKLYIFGLINNSPMLLSGSV